MKLTANKSLIWVLTAGVIGFATAAVFSGILHWQRPAFVLMYTLVVCCLIWVYTRFMRPNWQVQFQRRWRSGVAGGVILGGFLVWSVWRQPGSGRPEGVGILWSVVWYGLVYGAVDALLLNLVPVLEVFRVRPAEKLVHGGYRFRSSALALMASLLVTAIYHLGFVEYRGSSLRQPLLGNGIITAGYLITGSPITPLLGHVAMHIAAAVHGMETTTQLPPHYARISQ
jgi:hypothetical protein